MKNDNSKNLQYNSCTAKGICSVNPMTYALQSVLGTYISLCAKYCLKLLEKEMLEDHIADFILNVAAVTVANPEFTENTFSNIINRLRDILPQIIDTYNEVFCENDINGKDILTSEIFNKCTDITNAIKLGENFIKKNLEELKPETVNLYKILLITIKTLSINLIFLKSYGEKDKTALVHTLKILGAIYTPKTDSELKDLITSSSFQNIRLMTRIHLLQEKRYGTQTTANVSYSTTPSKAILIVGSNIRELEILLEATKDTNIDVYTHDDMMLAHTFPKFSEYKNLKGQYGHGVENCLIDFATFPGPIILTKYSLKNTENLYRGRLYTTDLNYCKGVIKIDENEFDEVIESAKNAKGFKKGKLCETVSVGYDFTKQAQLIDKKIKSEGYKKILFIGPDNHTNRKNDYFEKLIKCTDTETLVISFSYFGARKNIININTCFDAYALIRFFRYIQKYKLPVNVFLPYCNYNTISEIIYFKNFDNTNVFIGECQPIIINPAFVTILSDMFYIKEMTNPVNDLQEMKL